MRNINVLKQPVIQRWREKDKRKRRVKNCCSRWLCLSRRSASARQTQPPTAAAPNSAPPSILPPPPPYHRPPQHIYTTHCNRQDPPRPLPRIAPEIRNPHACSAGPRKATPMKAPAETPKRTRFLRVSTSIFTTH